MPFVKIEVTPEESEVLLLKDEELNRLYQEIGGGYVTTADVALPGNDSNLLIVFYVQIMPDDFVMQLHRF